MEQERKAAEKQKERCEREAHATEAFAALVHNLRMLLSDPKWPGIERIKKLCQPGADLKDLFSEDYKEVVETLVSAEPAIDSAKFEALRLYVVDDGKTSAPWLERLRHVIRDSLKPANPSLVTERAAGREVRRAKFCVANIAYSVALEQVRATGLRFQFQFVRSAWC